MQKKTFLSILLEQTNVKQADLARKLGWSPQRVGYLCVTESAQFPFDQLWRVKDALQISNKDLIAIQAEYFEQRGF